MLTGGAGLVGFNLVVALPKGLHEPRRHRQGAGEPRAPRAHRPWRPDRHCRRRGGWRMGGRAPRGARSRCSSTRESRPSTRRLRPQQRRRHPARDRGPPLARRALRRGHQLVVVNSVADDDYTRTKRAQEQLVAESGLAHCCLRPTLMFGCLDPKHLGWLARLMDIHAHLPDPGRRPLHAPAALSARLQPHRRVVRIEHQPAGRTYDIVGDTRIDYIDIIRTIKRVKRSARWSSRSRTASSWR